MASVGSDCHFELLGMTAPFRRRAERRGYYSARAGVSIPDTVHSAHELGRPTTRPTRAPGCRRRIDAYLDHLRVVRRLARSHARELRAATSCCSARFAAGAGRARRGARPRRPRSVRPRADDARATRRARSRGSSPRSAASTSSSSSIDGSTANPAEDLRAPRAWPALPKFCRLERGRSAARRARHVHAPGPARPRAHRTAVRDRPARLGAGRGCAQATSTSTPAI